MKNLKSLLLMLAMIMSISLLSTSCSDEDEPETEESKLCGTWIENTDEMPFVLVLNSDTSGSISYTNDEAGRTYSQKFSWSTGVTSDGLNYMNIIVASGADILENGRYSYTLIGNSLNLGSDLTFTRQ